MSKDKKDDARWERFIPPPPKKRGRKSARHKSKTKYQKKVLGVEVNESDES